MAMIEMVEVAPRDGLQNEKTQIATADKLALIERAIAAGARRIEVTSFVNPRAVPQMADGAEVLITTLDGIGWRKSTEEPANSTPPTATKSPFAFGDIHLRAWPLVYRQAEHWGGAIILSLPGLIVMKSGEFRIDAITYLPLPQNHDSLH